MLKAPSTFGTYDKAARAIHIILTSLIVCCKLLLNFIGDKRGEYPMEKPDYQYAQEKLAQLKADYQVEVVADWSDEAGDWKPGTWTKAELDKLHNAIALLADIMGENEKFMNYLCG